MLEQDIEWFLAQPCYAKYGLSSKRFYNNVTRWTLTLNALDYDTTYMIHTVLVSQWGPILQNLRVITDGSPTTAPSVIYTYNFR